MAHIAIIVPPLTGHINPTVALGQRLIERGHEVVWVGFSAPLTASLPAGLSISSLDQPLGSGDADARDDQETQAAQSRERDGLREARRGFAGLHFLWEEVLIPLARQTYSPVYQCLETARPDLCVVDQQMFSGAMACQALGLPYLTSSTTSAALIDALEALPQVAAWSTALLTDLWASVGLTERRQALTTALGSEPDRAHDLSPYGVISFSSRRLALSATPDAKLPSRVHFVGPALEGARAEIDFPWERLDPDLPRLFFSMGTVNAERATPLYARLIEALRDTPVQVIAAAPPEAFSDAPAHWIVQRRVPQLEVLAQVDAVFCHGGHNTTVEALAFGLPLIVTPIRDDQPVVAEQVKAVGAGLRLHFTRVRPAKLREAVKRALTDSTLREAALAVRREFMGDVFMESEQGMSQRPTRLAGSLGASRGAEVIERALSLHSGSSHH